MAKVFAPILSLVALAGSVDAHAENIIGALVAGAFSIIKHGNSRPFDDTVTALCAYRDAVKMARKAAALARKAGKAHPPVPTYDPRTLPLVESVRIDALAVFAEFKRAHTDPDGASAAIAAKHFAAYEAAAQADADARAVKSADAAAAKKKAADEVTRAAKSIAPLKAALDLADALSLVRIALAAGDASALAAVESFAVEFLGANVESAEPVAA